MTIQKNILHYYVDLLRMKDGEERTPKQSESCVTALHNVIRTMQLSRHDKVCGEDFSYLDFGNIPFNGIHWSMDGENPCRFDGCRLNELNYMGGHSGAINAVAWSPDGEYILTGGNDHFAYLWNVESGTIIRKLSGHIDVVSSVAFSYDGGYCLTGSYDSTAILWSTKDGSVCKILKGHTDRILSVAFHPKEKICLTGSADKSVKLWYYEKARCLSSLLKHNDSVTSVKFSYNGKYCFTASKDKTITMWELNLKRFNEIKNYNIGIEKTTDDVITYIRSFTGHTKGITSIDTSKLFDNLLLTGSEDGVSKVWNIENGKCVLTEYSEFGWYMGKELPDGTLKVCRVNKGHTKAISSVSFFPNDEKYLTGSLDKKIYFWTIKDPYPINSFSGNNPIFIKENNPIDEETFNAPILDLDFSPKGENIILGKQDGTADILNLTNHKIVRSLGGTIINHNHTIFLTNGDFILKDSNNTSSYWRSGKCFRKNFIPDDYDFLLDKLRKLSHKFGKSLRNGYFDDYKKLSDIEKKIIRIYWEYDETINSVDISSDNRHLLIGLENTTAVLWDLELYKCIKTFKCDKPVRLVAFSYGNNYFLTCLPDNTAKLWAIDSEEYVRDFVGHSTMIYTAMFSSDGNYLLTGSIDSAKLWNVSTGKCLKTIHSPINSHGSWYFPYYVRFENGAQFIYQFDFFGINNNTSPQLINVVYSVNHLYIDNCSFHNIRADEKVKKILYQYNAFTDNDSVYMQNDTYEPHIISSSKLPIYKNFH